MNDILIKTGSYDELYKDARKVRYTVFVHEQGVDDNIEQDDKDKSAIHAVLYENSLPIAALRIAKYDDVWFAGRVATLKEHRGKGYGAKIMHSIHEYARNNGIKEIHLHSQCHAQKFYEKLGYVPYGDVYEEAGIMHISMVWRG